MLVPTCLRGARRCSRAQWVTTTRSVSSSASADVRHLMAGWSMEVTPQAANKVKGSFGDFLPSNTAVNVTFLPGSDIDETIGVCERLSRDGMRPVPHVAARSLRDHMHLEEYLEGLQRRAGVSEVLVIGGGVTVPVGAFESSMQIAESGLLQKYGITRVGFGAHPEGSPDIPKDALVEAMRAKNAWAHEHRDAVEVYLETQFCFDAKSVFEWDKQMTQEGNRLPVHIGVAGPAKLATLIRFAHMSGVGASVRMLTRQPVALLKAMTQHTPRQFVCHLAAHVGGMEERSTNIRKLHFYSFGGVKTTAKWASDAAQTGLCIDEA